jgi:hypothetical protein
MKAREIVMNRAGAAGSVIDETAFSGPAAA